MMRRREIMVPVEKRLGGMIQMPLRRIHYETQPIDTSTPVRTMRHGGIVYGSMPKIVSKKNLIH
jgi:hypothetical protein